MQRKERPSHICDAARVIARLEIEAFDAELGEWLATPHGRFAAWLAEHDRAA